MRLFVAKSLLFIQMEKKFQLIESAIPEGGVAHTLPGLGTFTISEQLDDKFIENLPEKLRSKYFKPVVATAEVAIVEPVTETEDGKAKRK